MSFLLDALRKAESQKHLGNTPTIHSASVLETRTTANRRLGLVLVVLLPVLLVLAWFGLGDLLPGLMTGEQVHQEPVVTSGQPPADRTEAVAAPGNTALPEIPVAASDKTQLDTRRTPVESYTPDAAANHVQNPQASLPEPPEPERDAALAASNKVNNTPAPAPAMPVAAEPGSSPDTVQETAVISYWQLPESVRGQLVAIRISVMVYSDKPEERFIIMNGKRLVEGDEPQAGLVLEEIRRDGAVFSFRLYRFLVTR